MFNYLNKSTKAALIAYIILAISVFIAFVQINELQKDAAHRELVQQSTRYENCMASNQRISETQKIDESLIPAIVGLSQNPQHTDKTNEALKDVVGFLQTSQANTKLNKCYKPKWYVKDE